MLRTTPRTDPAHSMGIAGQAKFCSSVVHPLTFELNLTGPKVMNSPEMFVYGAPRFTPNNTYGVLRSTSRSSAWGTPTGTPRSTLESPSAIPSIRRPPPAPGALTRPPSTRHLDGDKSSGGSIIVLRPLTAAPSPLVHDHTAQQSPRSQSLMPTPRAPPSGSAISSRTIIPMSTLRTAESRTPEPPNRDRLAGPSPRVNLDRSRTPTSPVPTPTYEDRVMQWRKEMFRSYSAVKPPSGSDVGAPGA